MTFEIIHLLQIFSSASFLYSCEVYNICANLRSENDAIIHAKMTVHFYVLFVSNIYDKRLYVDSD